MTNTQEDNDLDSESIQRVANLLSQHGVVFDREPLKWYSQYTSGVIKAGLQPLAELHEKLDPDFSSTPFEDFFGPFRAQHCFRLPPFAWEIKLSEPQITRALAHLLDKGAQPLRAQRLQAFLRALGMKDVPAVGDLLQARVEGEYEIGEKSKGRIDLFVYNVKTRGPEPSRVIIIEAKLGDKVRKGQLKKYRSYIKEKFSCNPECFVLALTRTHVKKRLKGKQKNIWTITTWYNLWLRFEKLRPDEANYALSFLLNALWHRINP